MNHTGLRDYQIPSVEELDQAFHRWGSALDGSDTGTGKTYKVCAMLRHYDVPSLVVTPYPLIPVWERVGQYMGAEFDVLNYEMVRTGRTRYGTWEHVQNRRKKTIRRFNWDPAIKLLVFEEAHRCKNVGNGLNAAMMLAARRQQIPTLALTATPATYPFDLRALGFLLGLHRGGDFDRWLRRYNCRYDMFQGGYVMENRPGRTAAQAMDELRRQIFPEHGTRLTHAQIPNFPKNQILVDLYKIKEPGRIDALYAQMEAELQALSERRTGDKAPDSHNTTLLRLREEIELLKVPVFMNLMLDAYRQGRSPVLFVNFRSTLFSVMERFAKFTSIGGIYGQQKDRQQVIDSFQADELRALAVIASAGELGIGLHDVLGNYGRESIISPMHSALTLQQVFGRIHRDGALSPAIQRVVLAAGTSEEKIFHKLAFKMTNQQALVDGDLVPWESDIPVTELNFGVDTFESIRQAGELGSIEDIEL